MTKKEFYGLLKETECDMDYPYGSCQYETARIGYLAAKKAGVENLLCIFDENSYIELMQLKGNRKAIMDELKVAVLQCFSETNSDIELQAYWESCRQAVKKNDFGWIIRGLCDPDMVAEIPDIFRWETPDQAYKWMSEMSWDFWSAIFMAPAPELEELLTPEVNDGPVFNMMAWEEGYATGISAAFTEYLWGEEIDFSEWDT